MEVFRDKGLSLNVGTVVLFLVCACYTTLLIVVDMFMHKWRNCHAYIHFVDTSRLDVQSQPCDLRL